MPIFDSFNYQNSLVLVWKIEETEQNLMNQFSKLSNEVLNYQHIIREEPRKQKIASRLVAALLCRQNNLDYDDIAKDEFEKPFFKSSNNQISISHTQNFAVAVVSTVNVGIDIERISNKIQRIKHKFCNEKELVENNTDEELIYIWGAKEAMYKAYGRKQLLFAEEMNVVVNKGYAQKDSEIFNFNLFSKNYLNEYKLVLAEKI